MKIPEKSLLDLEFDTVLSQLSTHCITGLGKEAIGQIKPLDDEEQIVKNLQLVSEYVASFDNDKPYPQSRF